MLDYPWCYEGKAKFIVGKAFYRPKSQVVRDLGVLAAAVYRSNVGHLRVLDAMSGCGIRSLRYWQESLADWLWVNETQLPPYFYKLSEIGRQGKFDLPKRDYLIQALQSAGYQASATHINAQAIKTNANLRTCIKIAKKLKQNN